MLGVSGYEMLSMNDTYSTEKNEAAKKIKLFPGVTEVIV